MSRRERVYPGGGTGSRIPTPMGKIFREKQTDNRDYLRFILTSANPFIPEFQLPSDPIDLGVWNFGNLINDPAFDASESGWFIASHSMYRSGPWEIPPHPMKTRRLSVIDKIKARPVNEAMHPITDQPYQYPRPLWFNWAPWQRELASELWGSWAGHIKATTANTALAEAHQAIGQWLDENRRSSRELLPDVSELRAAAERGRKRFDQIVERWRERDERRNDLRRDL